MKNITIPTSPAEYQDQLLGRAFPEARITDNDFYSRLIGWVADKRTPLLYDQTHEDEYANFSINFNWLLLRDYKDTKLGPPKTILAMYALHEFTHMTHWLPTRLDEMTAAEYADQFTGSEYRASNESEILLHFRVPELRQTVLQGTKLAFDILKERGTQRPSAVQLAGLRALLIEDTVLDDVLGDTPENQQVVKFLKQFNGNREWAAGRFDVIQPLFSDPTLPLGSGLTHSEYEPTIANYRPGLSPEAYQANIVRNVRFGFAMCGLALPKITSLADARSAVTELEGQHAVV